MNYKERSKIICHLLHQRIKKEIWVLIILMLSFIYALVSNVLIFCSPLNLPTCVLNLMASVDETLRNCCYGIAASISFYFVNDFYKSTYKKVDALNAMYPDLYNLWLKTYQLVLDINNFKIDEKQDNNELYTSIMSYLSKDFKESNHYGMNLEISADKFHVLYVVWQDVLREKEKFLEVYGHMIEREEYSKLNDKEFDISLDILKEYVPTDIEIASAKTLMVLNLEIERAVYLILKLKTDLASIVNKYSDFYYDNQRGIKKDAF